MASLETYVLALGLLPSLQQNFYLQHRQDLLLKLPRGRDTSHFMVDLN